MGQTVINEFNVNYTGEEANSIFLKPVFLDEDITRLFRVMPNVKTKKKLAFASKLEKIVRRHTGCGFSPVGSLVLTEREVSVERCKVDLEMCWDEFEDTIYEHALRSGVDIGDITGTVIEQVLTTRVQEGIRNDTARLAYFGDTSNPDPAYNVLDGLWTVHYVDLVGAGELAYVNTNSGVALAPGDGISILEQVFEAQPLPLRGLPANMKRFQVSGSVYNQYLADLEAGGGGDFGIRLMQDGATRLFYRGIEVVPNWRWDEIESADFGQTNVHLVELAATDSVIIATDIVSDFTNVRIWYDDKEEKMFMKGRFKLGATYLHPELIVVGY